MAASVTVKQYDTYPPLSATLTDSNGPINLSTATSVEFVMVGNKTATKVTGACAITNATQGQVKYQWATNDLATPDTYQVEFAIHWASGVQKVPNTYAGNPTVEVDQDLTGAAE